MVGAMRGREEEGRRKEVATGQHGSQAHGHEAGLVEWERPRQNTASDVSQGSPWGSRQNASED